MAEVCGDSRSNNGFPCGPEKEGNKKYTGMSLIDEKESLPILNSSTEGMEERYSRINYLECL